MSGHNLNYHNNTKLNEVVDRIYGWLNVIFHSENYDGVSAEALQALQLLAVWNPKSPLIPALPTQHRS